MTLNELAWQILRDADCDEYTYGGAESANILTDLMSVYEPKDLAPYTYLEVANEILSFSHPRPIERKPFKVQWDTDDCTDATSGEDTLSEAQETLWEIYEGWMDEERTKWKGLSPSDEEKADWDYMIYNCGAVVQKYNPDTDEYEDYWEPTQGELESAGWRLFGEE